jgi:hypothetical protein
VTPRCLEVVLSDVYMCTIDNWPNNWAAASFLTGAHVSELLQNRQTGTMAARALRARSHAYAVSERKLYEHGYCEVV